MADHLSTLFRLTDTIEELDMIQDWINGARTAAPTNQVVQLALDHHQSDVDRKRKLIYEMMRDIRNRN